MKKVALFLFLGFGLAVMANAQTAMADITGTWKGNFFQQNYIDPNAADFAYKAEMKIEQHGTDVTGTCVIFWYDSDNYWGRWRFSGTYENGKFNYTELSLDEDHCKPGFSWCLKDVESLIQYNPEKASWMLSGKFKAFNGFSECSPGRLFFEKEGDI